MKVVAIIPARGGSKSIPLKNIKLINGRPLIYWSIDAAVSCKWIDEVYVSTDSALIEEVVSQYDRDAKNKLKCIKRSAETATDEASTEAVLAEFVSKITSDYLVLIQATSPLLQSNHLDGAFEIMEEDSFDSMLSVVRQKRFIWSKEGESAKPTNYNIASRPRRQEFNGFLVENGAFYITKTSLFEESGIRISGKIGMYEMPEETYYEIDEPSDWSIVESFLKKQGKNAKTIKLFATDCDGVLTDGGMYYSVEGDLLKKFNAKDGMGFELLRNKGIKTAILTGENSEIVSKRAQKLKIDDVYLGCKDKLSAMKELIQKYDISLEEVAYIGDDINDLELLKSVGLSFSVSDAIEEVKEAVHIVTSRNGGQGAVREAVQHIVSE